jgi:hypothetical protein
MFYPGSRIRIRPLLNPGSGSRIRGVKKHQIPDPDRIRNTVSYKKKTDLKYNIGYVLVTHFKIKLPHEISIIFYRYNMLPLEQALRRVTVLRPTGF